jgi:hypothetical protein
MTAPPLRRKSREGVYNVNMNQLLRNDKALYISCLFSFHLFFFNLFNIILLRKKWVQNTLVFIWKMDVANLKLYI